MKRYIVTMIISGIFIFISGFILMIVVPHTIELYAEGDEYSEGSDIVSRLDRCDGRYYDQEYGELYYKLVLSNCVEEEFDKHWEVVNGFLDYYLYKQWSNCDESRLPGSYEKAEYYREKVIENANNVEFSLNQKRLEELAEEVE